MLSKSLTEVFIVLLSYNQWLLCLLLVLMWGAATSMQSSCSLALQPKGAMVDAMYFCRVLQPAGSPVNP